MKFSIKLTNQKILWEGTIQFFKKKKNDSNNTVHILSKKKKDASVLLGL